MSPPPPPPPTLFLHIFLAHLLDCSLALPVIAVFHPFALPISQHPPHPLSRSQSVALAFSSTFLDTSLDFLPLLRTPRSLSPGFGPAVVNSIFRARSQASRKVPFSLVRQSRRCTQEFFPGTSQAGKWPHAQDPATDCH